MFIKRNAVFETASSSVHTLSIGGELEKPNFRIENGCIIVKGRYFGKDERIYSSQEDKLCYLMAELYCMYTFDDSVYDSYKFHYIVEAIQNYGLDIDGIKVEYSDWGDDFGMDHQEANEAYYGDFHFINVYDEKSIQSFLFNPNIMIHTDCD